MNRGAARYCCVPNCKKNERKNRDLTFYSFPGREWEQERKKKWINAVNRFEKSGQQWLPTKNSRICSSHFAGGKKSNDPRSPAYVPSIFSDADRRKTEGRMARYQRARNRASSSTFQPPTGANIHVKMEEQQVTTQDTGVQTEYIDVIYKEEPPLLFCSINGNESSSQTNIVIKPFVPARPKLEMEPYMKDKAVGPEEALPRGFVGFADITTDAIMKQFGGVSLSFFHTLLNFIVPGSYGQPHYFKVLRKENRLLLFLMKMKLGISFGALGCLFNISSTTTSRIFVDVLTTLSKGTETWIFWLPRATIKDALPAAFRRYPNCRAIIDCTELPCDAPPTVEQRLLFYNNKGRYTVKFLIAIAPNGLITFVSRGYEGRTTDGFVINECGFLNLIEPEDVIMADKRFPEIEAQLAERNATVLVPPFCRNSQFTEQEVEEGYQVESVRRHVERGIQKIRMFGILKHINAELLPHIDNIIHVCCVLANNQPPLLKKEESD